MPKRRNERKAHNVREERATRERRGERKVRRARVAGHKRRTPASRSPIKAAPVTAAELGALRRELKRRTTAMRWNPEADDVQRSVVQLVLTLVEFIRRLMERQAIRRMEQETLTPRQVEALGLALMELERTIRDIGKRFGLTPEELNLDLGPVGKLM